MGPWKMFAHEIDGKFVHVFPREVQVSMCGSEEIVPVLVEFHADEQTCTHWGWLDGEKGTWDGNPPSMLQDAYFILDMCFPYGIQAEIDRGRGQPITLFISRLEIQE